LKFLETEKNPKHMRDLNQKAGEFLKKNIKKISSELFLSYIEHIKESGRELKPEDYQSIQNGIRMHILYLAESISYSENSIYENAIKWARRYLLKINIPIEAIVFIIKSTAQILENLMPKEIREITLEFLKNGMEVMQREITEEPSHLDTNQEFYEESRLYLEYIIRNEKESAAKVIFDLLNNGTSIKEVYIKIFQPVQNEIGRLWQKGEVTLAHQHYATAVTQLVMSQMYSYIFQKEKSNKLFIGACAPGEIHEIGLRMFTDLIDLEGWNTIYLGSKITQKVLIKTISENKPDAVGISAALAHYLSDIRNIIEKIKTTDGLEETKIIVGGYVFNNHRGLWKQVGADYYGQDALEGLNIINSLK